MTQFKEMMTLVKMANSAQNTDTLNN